MNKLNVFIDESGAKGYSDNKEHYEGEFGIVAGIFIEEMHLKKIKEETEKIYHRYLGKSDKKLHITDLAPELQKSLRSDVFHLIRNNNIYWSYQAIYVNGFYNDKYKEQKIKGLFKHNNSLHVELLFGIYIQSRKFSDSLGIKKCDIVSDQIDTHLIDLLNKKVKGYLSLGDEKPITFKNYDRNDKTLREVGFKVSVNTSEDEKFFLNSFEYDFRVQNNECTLIADVLSNSLFYHLKNKIKDKIGIDLMKIEHFKDHELFDSLFLDSEKNFTDKCYPYKNNLI
jgi:hypothetical protein